MIRYDSHPLSRKEFRTINGEMMSIRSRMMCDKFSSRDVGYHKKTWSNNIESGKSDVWLSNLAKIECGLYIAPGTHLNYFHSYLLNENVPNTVKTGLRSDYPIDVLDLQGHAKHPYLDFGAFIQNARRRVGFTSEMLTDEVGENLLPLWKVGRIERGEIQIKLYVVYLISWALETDLWYEYNKHYTETRKTQTAQ